MSEFDLIRRLQEVICAPGARYRSQCALGIGDDGALLELPPQQPQRPQLQLVACTDTLVEGVHFPVGTAPEAIGHKALAVNLSDLAAMGAEPAWFLLALTLPSAAPAWLEPFAQGMARLASGASIFLAGGDVAAGPLNICVTALGLVEKGRALTRAGAAVGDLVVVSGRPGAAAHALAALQAGRVPDARERAALDFPQPRLELGLALRGLATACIDLSDGLLADLGHILEASGVGAELELRRLPCAESMAAMPEAERWRLQLAGGDDYELCFTLPAGLSAELDALRRRCGLDLTVIGRITAQKSLALRAPDGSPYRVERAGYEHFAEPCGEALGEPLGGAEPASP
jgi:thiamine-monophosphate kinase